ncbi:MAG TPA: biosynthetic peptidoglycan transglycosylase [Erysipelothrix sp.]
MKKVLSKIILIIILSFVLFSSVIFYQGYQEYQKVTAKESIEAKVAQVQSQDFSEYEAIAPLFLDAIMVTEDARFYYRDSPIDRIALMRALKVNLKHKGFYEGGSTIPQQLAKNLYFDHSASLVRKVSEYFIARDIMDLYSHNEIIALYANVIYYGDGYLGITQASYGYFDLAPKDLNDFQATLLAGLPQAPSIYQLSTNYEGALKRQEHVLNRLVDEHYLTENEKHEIISMGGIDHEKEND